MRYLLFFVCSALFAQPKVGMIEIFGNRKVSPEKIRKALAFSEGEALAGSKADLEERIESLDDVVLAKLEAVCCTEGKAILYVGIEEKGSPHFDFRTPPALDLKVPEEVMAEWIDFAANLQIAIRKDAGEEDMSRGHSFMRDPETRKNQEQFVELAERHYHLLREVLKSAVDEQQRGVAAYVLGYAKNKKQAAEDLQYAMQDGDETVRNNAMRALMAIQVLANREPESGIQIKPTWFVEMLNSVYFADRNKAAAALVYMTEKRDPATLGLMKERALPALIEMSAWRHLPHAFHAFLLLGRMAGFPEDEIQQLWTKTDRQTILAKLKDSAKHAK